MGGVYVEAGLSAAVLQLQNKQASFLTFTEQLLFSLPCRTRAQVHTVSLTILDLLSYGDKSVGVFTCRVSLDPSKLDPENP
jgi:hypothetical protein